MNVWVFNLVVGAVFLALAVAGLVLRRRGRDAAAVACGAFAVAELAGLCAYTYGEWLTAGPWLVVAVLALLATLSASSSARVDQEVGRG